MLDMNKKGLTIISDGTVMGTKVFDNEGKDVTSSLSIRGVQFQHRAGGIPQAVLTCSVAAIEASNLDGVLVEDDIREITTLDKEYREYEKLR